MTKRPPPSGSRANVARVGSLPVLVLSFPSPALAALTAVEHALASAILSGTSNRAIARARRRSPNTIAKQLTALYRKLGVGSRAELAAKLTELGYPLRTRRTRAARERTPSLREAR